MSFSEYTICKENCTQEYKEFVCLFIFREKKYLEINKPRKWDLVSVNFLEQFFSKQ